MTGAISKTPGKGIMSLQTLGVAPKPPKVMRFVRCYDSGLIRDPNKIKMNMIHTNSSLDGLSARARKKFRD